MADNNPVDPLAAAPEMRPPPPPRGRGRRGRVGPVAPPIQRRRPTVYTQAQKERAILLLDMGVTCRAVAKLMGPYCSSGTPIRWKKQAIAAEAARNRLEAAIADAGRGLQRGQRVGQVPAAV